MRDSDCVTEFDSQLILIKPNIEITNLFWKYFSYNDINKISKKQFCEMNSLDFSFLMTSRENQEFT